MNINDNPIGFLELLNFDVLLSGLAVLELGKDQQTLLLDGAFECAQGQFVFRGGRQSVFTRERTLYWRRCRCLIERGIAFKSDDDGVFVQTHVVGSR